MKISKGRIALVLAIVALAAGLTVPWSAPARATSVTVYAECGNGIGYTYDYLDESGTFKSLTSGGTCVWRTHQLYYQWFSGGTVWDTGIHSYPYDHAHWINGVYDMGAHHQICDDYGGALPINCSDVGFTG
jgi:hypothetical protein